MKEFGRVIDYHLLSTYTYKQQLLICFDELVKFSHSTYHSLISYVMQDLITGTN